MICKHCRYQNMETAKYCVGCGKRLSDDGKRKWLLSGVMVIMILAAGILMGTVLFGEKENTALEKTAMGQQNLTEAAVAVAQETTEKTTSLVLAYSEKAHDAPAYYYNEEGQMVRKVQEQGAYVTEYAYHANGAMKKESVIRNGSTWYVTEFDDHGNPLAEYSAGELLYSYTNQYDDQDRLVLCTKTVEGERKDIYQYTYDENGWYEQDYTYITIWNGEESVHDQVWRRYSPEGVLVHETWEVADYLPGNKGITYTLDDRGNLVMKSYQSWSDTTSQREDTYFEHTYNSKGLVTKTEVSYCGYYMSPDHNTNTDITLKEIVTYTYDAEDRMTAKTVQNVEHGFTIENIWEYDAAGNLVRFYGVPDDEYSWYVEEIWQYKPLSEVLSSD